MSKNWYPVINYSKCNNCGKCVENCNFGVYDKDQYPKPEVINIEGCIEGCNGCANLCPNGAIKYRDTRESGYCGPGCSCKGGCC
ncbi:4Fe-4S ferredoxin [Romboutsia weinsteinii]|uniref:4Fe-4S ferredoxin n=1 Tax=Romboutsia weinsteinii TaxID=2020949 RepID=A0A371J646_9FIRM|nr:4Fe-4S binding protein [Romboutsia weinsteinii]RDY28163.1 4Fe-4S ferredoxin [Romboutsia weinsteinii]